MARHVVRRGKSVKAVSKHRTRLNALAFSVSLNGRAEIVFLLNFVDCDDHPDDGRNQKYDYGGQRVSRPFVSRLFVRHTLIVSEEFRRFNDVNLESWAVKFESKRA
jgi:hypothetical protein